MSLPYTVQVPASFGFKWTTLLGSRSVRTRAPAGGRPAARQPRHNELCSTPASSHNRSRSCAVSRQAAAGSIYLTLQDDAWLARPAGGRQALGPEDVPGENRYALIHIWYMYYMTNSKKITMKLADVRDTLAKEAHDEWEELGRKE